MYAIDLVLHYSLKVAYSTHWMQKTILKLSSRRSLKISKNS
jgi:hypothetical protein